MCKRDIRNTIVAIMAIATSTLASAGNSIRELWIAMPDTATVYLDSLTKRDMLYYYDNGVGIVASNIFGDSTSIDTITDGYMCVNMSKAMQMQLRVFTKTDSTQVICMVRTYKSDDGLAANDSDMMADVAGGESDVAFFDSEWRQLDDMYGLPLCLDEDSLLSQLTFLPDTMTQKRYAELRSMIDPVMLLATLSADTETITLTLATPMLRKDEREDVKTIIVSREFKWNGSMFK